MMLLPLTLILALQSPSLPSAETVYASMREKLDRAKTIKFVWIRSSFNNWDEPVEHGFARPNKAYRSGMGSQFATDGRWTWQNDIAGRVDRKARVGDLALEDLPGLESFTMPRARVEIAGPLAEVRVGQGTGIEQIANAIPIRVRPPRGGKGYVATVFVGKKSGLPIGFGHGQSLDVFYLSLDLEAKLNLSLFDAKRIHDDFLRRK